MCVDTNDDFVNARKERTGPVTHSQKDSSLERRASVNWLLGRAKSVRCAAMGIGHLVRSEPNARVHVVATLGVVSVAGILRLGAGEWLWLIAAIAMVWMAEAFNTALERLADATCPEHHPLVGRAKDVAAGAVLLGAIAAAAIGLCIMVPHLAWLNGASVQAR
jgi:diacylglycerol kinase (ATP)